MLAENYTKAIKSAECMFRLKQPNWYLKSTIGNIHLINRFRKKPEDLIPSPEEQVFKFWTEYFIDAIKEEAKNQIKFPILIHESNKTYVPSWVMVNADADVQSITIENLCLDCLKELKCKKPHKWLIKVQNLRGVSLYKRDERCVFLYVHLNADDFQMFFASELMRKRFYELVCSLSTDQQWTNFDLLEDQTVDYEYDLDERNCKIVLGKGSYGTVYSAKDKKTQVTIAVKEVPIKNPSEIQPLKEEIKLHSQLRHRNIVQYLGCICENNTFKIFMESVWANKVCFGLFQVTPSVPFGRFPAARCRSSLDRNGAL